MAIKHSKVSAVPDGSDASKVRPSDWNADHVIDGTIPASDLDLSGVVPNEREVAGLDLSANRSASDVKTALALVKGDVGLGNVDNTADVDKPVSTAQQAALDAKVPTSRTVNGHALSDNVTVAAEDIDGTLPATVKVDAGTGTAVAGIGGVLTVSTTQAATGANTTETDLWTYSLPANTLSANGYFLRVQLYASFAANANTKTVRMYFGATSSTVNSVTSAPNGLVLAAEYLIDRTGAGAQALRRFMSTVGGTTQGPGKSLATENEGTTIVIRVTGQNGTASAGDIVLERVAVEFLRAGS